MSQTNTALGAGGVTVPKEKLVEIANLELDCKIGKDRHFIAAGRKNLWRIGLGLFSVIGSAVMASKIGPNLSALIHSYFAEYKYIDEIVSVLGGVLPLLVGISTAVIGFLGLEKQTAQHRFVGNSYIEIARKARSLINDVSASPEKLDAALGQYEKLLAQYFEINKEGEACPTNPTDSEVATRMNQKRRGAVKAKVQEFDIATLGIKEHCDAPRINLWNAVVRSTKFRIASTLTFLGILRKSDFRKFARSL